MHSRSDIDLVVLSKSMDQRSREATLRSIAGCLRARRLAEDIQVIGRAKVPIIKFVCPYGHFHVDISINQANGLQAARLVNRWLAKMPGLRPLVMVVKQLLQQRALSEVFTGGLGSYSVTLLVLSFLQLHPKLQREEIAAERNLGVLLLEFLELYGKNFGYDECGITVRGHGGYFSKRQRGWYDARKPFMLSIEDPHDVGNDIAKGSFAIISVRSALGGAFDILHAALCERANDLHAFRKRQRALYDAQRQNKHTHFDDAGDSRLHITSQTKEPESLLGSVLGVSREMIKRRTEIKELYESNALQGQLDKLPRVERPTADSHGEKRTAPADAQPAPKRTKAEPSKEERKAQKQDRKTLEREHEAERSAAAAARRAEQKADVRPDDEDAATVHAPEGPVRRRAERNEDSEEDSKYAAPGRARKRQRDVWSGVELGNSDESDADLIASDAPFVTESSDSEPAEAPAPKRTPAQGVSIAGRAKRERTSTLSKRDRMAFWSAKSGASSRGERESP